MATRKKTTKRKPAAPRKPATHREPAITTTKRQCPRCGETEWVQLVYTSTSGVRRFRCYSETCKGNAVAPGRGRMFVIMPD
jgi:transposase-like protein